MNDNFECPECNEIVYSDNTEDTDGKLCYHARVCKKCYENLEDDNWDCRDVCSQ